MAEYYAKITRAASRSTHVASTPPTSGGMTVWHLRDFLRALDAAGIPDNETLTAEHAHDTKHFTGLRVRHVESIPEGAPDGAA